MDSRMNQYWEHEIKTLSEGLESLRITKENASEETTKYMDKMSTILVNKQIGLSKYMVLDPG